MLLINDDIIKEFLFRGYAYQVKERFSQDYVKKGMVHAKKLQNKKLRYEMEFVR